MTQLMDPAGLKPVNLCRHISHRLQRLLVGRSIILYSQRTIKVLIKLSGYDLHLHSWHIAKTGVSDTDTYIIWYI